MDLLDAEGRVVVRVSLGGDVGAVKVNSGSGRGGRGRSVSDSFFELRVKSTDWCFRLDKLWGGGVNK